MAAREKKQQSKEEKTVREITAAERAVIKKHLARLEAKPSVRFKVSKTGSNPQIEFDHPDELVGPLLVMEALASADQDFVNGIVRQLADASGHDQEIDERGLNFMLSVIKGVEPRDQLETMLAAQMAVIHVVSMSFARHFALIETLPQQDSAERAFNKLTRTFAMQMEALKRYRSGAEQKVTLQHVSVAEGGQAIVGHVTHAPRESARERPAHEETVPPPGLTEAKDVPMLRKRTTEEHEPGTVGIQ